MSGAQREEQRSVPPTVRLLDTRRPTGERHRLVVWMEGVARSWRLPRVGEAVIGRADDSAIRIDAAAVSRKHAVLLLRSGAVTVTDAGSSNGTRVNGTRLLGERALAYGDVITFGDVYAVFEEDRGQSTTQLGALLSPDGCQIDLGKRTALVADSVMLHVYAQLQRLAVSGLSVLITGETGTGKDLAAAALQYWSKRQAGPFVTLNCAALPDNLLESELFGYERGAFSGAVRPKAGLFETASGGTLFLDEIGDLTTTAQAKLLRVVEERKVQRLGSLHEHQVDVRLITATHRDLPADVVTCRFRQDLYYRLSAAVVTLPPLRVRMDEVPLLARKFLDEACQALARPSLTITSEGMDLLRKHTWPGNVRELKNVMDYVAATVIQGAVEAEHLGERLKQTSPFSEPPRPSPRDAAPALSPPPKVNPFSPSQPTPNAPQALADATRDFERRNIEAALAASGGNKTLAAKLLGMPLRTFMYKFKRLGCADPKAADPTGGQD